MEVKIRYKQKTTSEIDSVNDGHSVVNSDQRTKRREKDKLMMRMYQFTEQQLSDLKHAFNEYDSGRSGRIATRDLGNAMRSVGQAPTESELKDMLQGAILDDTGKMKLEEFLRLVGDRGLQTDKEILNNLEEALRFFDKDGRGLLSAGDLRTALQSYGEPLNEKDLKEMIKMAGVRGDGRIDYLEFVRKMASK